MSAIVLRGLVKKYGDVIAVDRLDLTVPTGAVFGFLGPNGAGKTTTIKILTGLAKATAGTATVLGVDIARAYDRVGARIGYLPENPAFYGWMTAKEYLRFCADIFALDRSVGAQRIADLLDFAGLAKADRPIGGYSRGMKQRLGLAQALINDPEVLFLDEPTSALDPMGRKEVLNMIADLARDKTVFFSTHILADVERVCDRVAMLNKGKLVLDSDLPTLKADYLEPVISMEFGAASEPFATLVAGLPWVVDIKTEGRTATLRVNALETAERELPGLIARSSLPLRRFQIGEVSLEDIFMKVMA